MRADYLMWWTSGMKSPPLVTTSTPGAPVERAGVLGYNTTSILYGGNTAFTDGQSGYRTTLGMWIDDCHDWDAEFDYFFARPTGQHVQRNLERLERLANPFTTFL